MLFRIAIADLIRVAAPELMFAEDVAFTLFFSYGLILGYIAIISYARRFLSYIASFIVLFSSKKLKQAIKIIMLMNRMIQGE